MLSNSTMMNLHEEAARCLLCADAPCSKACGKGDVARAIRAVRFDNAPLAARWAHGCTDAQLEAAQEACIHYDRPIRIPELVKALPAAPAASARPSLAIDFCGIRCENPFFLASSAVCTNYDMVARAFEAGWGGVFYKTICKQ
ncbi:MAG: NAD-dependent dihydropyrimidine dehydrogenase subunit PreA, partial [Bacteroidales bacterium]|nr:NAD-dependent dihydropyrimidine dehydrogenase subunit PreA [Bacteroidales bacterium]